ncbi:MAG: hypothetical protein R3284_10110, partial [Rubricoccaceae bacterium]|nr:hypothetical protein [Rubricoccaceae bacterium]
MKIARWLIRTSVPLVLLLTFIPARAAPTDILAVWTGDNVVKEGFFCFGGIDCPGGAFEFASGLTNADEWRDADSAIFDFGAGDFALYYVVKNVRPPTAQNPGGFLAEIAFA